MTTAGLILGALTILLGMKCSPAAQDHTLRDMSLLALMAKPAKAPTLTQGAMTFDQFRSQAFRESINGTFTGTYIVSGDSAAVTESHLRQFYNEYVLTYRRAHPAVGMNLSTVYNIGGVDVVWTEEQRMHLTYCVSDAFTTRKAAVVLAMGEATAAWQAAANVRFIYDPTQDARCDLTNLNVLFDVSRITGQSYLARAFFPNNDRENRNIMIDTNSFWISPPYTLTGILRHELGHILGLRHEQTRPEAGICFEDNGWRPVSGYDPSSVMHYPECNGTGDGSFILTPPDIAGISALYGPGVVP